MKPVSSLVATLSSVLAICALGFSVSASDNDALRVRGFFCDAKADQIAFLTKQAQGENEIMAANAVNKSLAKQSCAYYLPATAIPSGHHTVISDGLVYKLESYVFLPERVERWSGTALGSLQTTAHDQNI